MAIELPDLKGRIRIDDSALEKVGNSTKSLGTRLSSVGATLTKGLTLPIVGAGAAGVKMALDVDKGLREVNTLFGQTGTAAEKTFKELQSGTRDLSNEIGIAQDVLVGGLYQAISAGVPGENAFEFMEIAAKAAVAGVTDTETAVDGLTSTLNAFGLDASRAQDVADSMFTTVKGGKTTFEELAASLFQVAPAAAAAGVEFTDVNAALASLTFAGTPTTVATTQLRQAIVELTKDGTKAGDAFKAVSGKTFPEFVASGGNLKEALDLLKEGANESGSSMLDMFGSVEAGQAALTLTGKASEKFGKELDNQADAAGAATKAFEEMEKSGGRKLEKTMTRLKNSLIDVGNVLLPIVADIADAIGKWAKRFSELSPGMQKAIVIIGGLVAAIGPALFVVGKIISSFGMLTKAIRTVGIVFRGLALALSANPFVLIIAAVAALAFIIIKNWDTIKEATLKAWNAVKDFLGEAWESIKEVATTVWNAIKDFFAQFWPIILGIFTGGLGLIVGLIVKNWDSIKAKTSEVWEAIKKFFSETWDKVKTVFTDALDAVKETLSKAWESVKQTVTNTWDGIKGFLGGVWDAIVAIAQRIWNGWKRILTTVLEAVRSIITNIWNGISGFLSGVWNSIKNTATDIFNGIKSAITGAIDAAKAGVERAVNAVIGFFRRLWDRAKYYVDKVVSAIKSLPFVPGSPIPMVTWAGQTQKGVLKAFDGLSLDNTARRLGKEASDISDRLRDRLQPPDLRTSALSAVENRLAMAGRRVATVGAPAVANEYHFHFDGTWDLTDPNQAYAFGEKAVRIIQRVERAKA